MEIIKKEHNDYPKKLKQLYDSPKQIYIEGNRKILDSDSIAIIGSRVCSKYGASMAYNFGYELAKKGIVIISGLARGIDSYAHLGAVSAKGKTIAVLGSGLKNIYPKENLGLCREILKYGGAIITEYNINEKPEKKNFPARNRIISGLSNGVLVVEAKKKSGTLITVDFSLDYGKDIFCIPGNITSEYSYNTNELIKQGAILVTNVNEIIEYMKYQNM